MKLNDTDALLVVDVQRDFLPGGSLAVPEGDGILPVLAACIRVFAERGLPIFASRDWHPADHCSFEENGGPWPPHCIVGTTGAEIHPGLRLPEDTTIISKATTRDRDAYSAFDATDLDERLRQLGVERLVVGGLATEVCVYNTVIDALKLGYDVELLTDAIGAIDGKDGEKAIAEMREKNATITDSSGIVAPAS